MSPPCRTSRSARPPKHRWDLDLARRLLWMVLCLLLAGCCPPFCPPPPGEDRHIGMNVALSMGQNQNRFDIRKLFYAGAETESFRLRFEFRQPNGTLNWPAGVRLRLLRADSVVLQEIARNTTTTSSAFESGWITGNTARIQLTTDGAVANVGQAALVITRITPRLVDDPDALAPEETALTLPWGEEVVAIAPRTNVSQHFRVAGTTPGTGSLYVSPFAPDLWNDAALAVGMAGINVPTDLDQSPFRTDSAVYDEFGLVAHDSFVSVRTGLSIPYLITVQRMLPPHGTMTIEMAESLNGGSARTMDRDDLAAQTSVFLPYMKQLADFVRTNATYPQRIHELLVLLNAWSLGATDGQQRFGRMDIFHAFDAFRDVELQFYDSCVAPATITTVQDLSIALFLRIELGLQEMDDPIAGALILLHEWGHFDYHIGDEDGGICPNSLMGGRFLPEFCGSNHLWLAGVGHGSASSWDFISAKYGINPAHPQGIRYPQNQGRYFDALNRLEQLMEFRNFPNASPTPNNTHLNCGVRPTPWTF